MEKVEVEIPEKNIDSWHRVGNQGSNLVKFHRRKKFRKVLNVKTNIQKITVADLDLPGSIKLYLNESLSLLLSSLIEKHNILQYR